MKTGIELIADERQEQIEKHGFSPEVEDSNREMYDDFQMKSAVMFALTLEEKYWPEGWYRGYLAKIQKKDYKGALIVAGALIAAEIDRVNRREQEL